MKDINDVLAQPYSFLPSTSPKRQIVLSADRTVRDATGVVNRWAITGPEPTITIYLDNNFVARCKWDGRCLRGNDMSGPAELQPDNPRLIKDLLSEERPVKLHVDQTTRKADEKLVMDYPLARVGNGRTAVALLACDRPGYYRDMLTALAPQIKDYDSYLFIDRAENPDLTAEQVKVTADLLPKCKVVARPINWGCGMNLIEARERLFVKLEYNRVFMFEDDFVPDRNYVEYLEQLWDYGQTYSNVGAVQGWSRCFLSIGQKKKVNREVYATYDNAWGYLMGRECWMSIRQMMIDYTGFILNKAYANRDNLQIGRWHKQFKERPFFPRGDNPFPTDEQAATEERWFLANTPTSQDGMTYLAMRQGGWVRLTSTVNRGVYIGKSGIHSTPDLFRRQGLDKIEVSNLSLPKEFKPRGKNVSVGKRGKRGSNVSNVGSPAVEDQSSAGARDVDLQELSAK